MKNIKSYQISDLWNTDSENWKTTDTVLEGSPTFYISDSSFFLALGGKCSESLVKQLREKV